MRTRAELRASKQDVSEARTDAERFFNALLMSVARLAKQLDKIDRIHVSTADSDQLIQLKTELKALARRAREIEAEVGCRVF